MGVYVKGMEMPFTCLSCEFHKCYGGAGDYCTLTKKKQFRFKNRPSWCPLVSVSPHGRLGDLDKLEKMFADIDSAPYSCFDGTEPFYSAEDAAHIIKLAPTIIPASEEDES